MGPSPALSGVGSPGSGNGSPGTSGLGNLDWLGKGNTTNIALDAGGGGGGGNGLESMFSRLSYSAAASRPTQPPPSASQTNSTGTPAMSRHPSGGKPWQPGSNASGPLSPLSGPVLTGDDDDLFSMDG
jgi:hypothetical protein